MKQINVDNIVESITILQTNPEGGYDVQRLSETGKRKKQSKLLGKLEKNVRKIVKVQGRMADIYLTRHNKSNCRKRNGWLWDMGKNVKTAARKGSKKPRLTVVQSRDSSNFELQRKTSS